MTVLYQSAPLPYGLWSDGQFMWVSDDNHNRVYHNENPKWAANAALKTLRASDPAGGLNISPGFAAATTSYTVHTNPGEWVVTLSAETTAGGGWVTYHDIDNNNALLTDADPNTGGFQFRVEQIEHNIRVTRPFPERQGHQDIRFGRQPGPGIREAAAGPHVDQH